MASYLQWNSAITHYILKDCQPGDAVYLSVDEEFVEACAAKYLKDKLECDAIDDLLLAVRERCIDDDLKVRLETCSGFTKKGNCCAVAFLSVLVLAAFEMGNIPGQGQQAYFDHLRRLLGFHPAADGQIARPPGMAISQTTGAAPEEILWDTWNAWLQMKGFIPTAVPGSGATRYTRYAVSQTLLRAADIRNVRRFFANSHLSQRIGTSWDKEDVLDSIYVESQRTPCSISSHVLRIISEHDEERIAELGNAIYRVYQAMDWDLEVLREISKGNSISNVRAEAGTLRGELTCFHEPLDNSFEFAMRVKIPGDADPADLSIQVDEGHVQLQPFIGMNWALLAMPEGCHPSWNGTYPILGHQHLTSLYLPRRQFWLLKQRAESLDTFTPDGALIAGEEILLVCSNDLVPHIEDWKHLGQMDWVRKVPLQDNWCAFWKFVVLSEEVVAPASAPDDVSDFASACQRSKTPAILLSGGLKDPNGAGWLEKAMPLFTIVGTETPVKVSVSAVNQDYPLCEMSDIYPGTQCKIERDLPAGAYTIHVRQGHKSLYRRPFRILKWQLLSLGKFDGLLAEQHEVVPEVV